MADELKKRIEKQWGEVIAKEADAAISSMGAQWAVKIAMLQAHTAREEFKKNVYESWVATSGRK